jgi:dolichol kinase
MAHVGEVLRKSVHLGSVVIPVAAVLVEKRILVVVLLVIAVTLLIVDVLKIKHKPFKRFFHAVFGKMLRDREVEGGMTASTIVVASAALTVFLFRTEIAVTALVFLSVGDSFAALIGRHFGTIKLVGQRTLEGSLAALNACLFASVFLISLNPILGWKLSPIALLVGSVAATLAELLDIPLDDNLRIPVIAGTVMELIIPG